jgi:hypothetical protein
MKVWTGFFPPDALLEGRETGKLGKPETKQ